jgi:tRNA dimethylallyltransferase
LKEGDKYLITIIGPTAVGKTSLAIKLAQYFRTEIISADSRQVYREMNIGTAKPSEDELDLVKHHFINSHSIHDEFNAGSFEREALHILGHIFRGRSKAIMVGGSGLYIDALIKGFDGMPPTDPVLRDQLNEQFLTEGLDSFLHELKENDPEYFTMVDKKNPIRVIRAIEVMRISGKTYSSFRKRVTNPRGFKVLMIGLNTERDILYRRIEDRMEQMIRKGLFKEAERLHPYRALQALQTVGYSEIFGFLEGKYDREEAVRLLKRNSRRYAKRQITWFNKYEAVQWFDPLDELSIMAYIESNT